MVVTDIDYENLNIHFEKLLEKDLINRREVNDCPHCNSNKIIKHGTYKNGQRYRCKICGRTFCRRTATPFYYSKKKSVLWVKYMELMIQKNTLKECSKKLEIDISTAFYWRHKIMNALINIMEPTKLVSYIEIAKLSIKENFKGSRNVQKENRENIWTIIAADKQDKILAHPISRGRWDLRAFNKIIYSRIDKDAYILGRSDRFLWCIERNHNKGRKVIMNKENILKNYYRDIKNCMRKYYGVATKYLTNYLHFIGIFSVKMKYDAVSLIYNIINSNSHLKNNEFKNMQLDFERRLS